ncbi:MAG: ribosome biogenesis GTPase Der [Rhodospirillaceae bacterium]
MSRKTHRKHAGASPRKQLARTREKRGEARPSFTVAIVGRPNVGKSTLFNRLIGRREAIVHDRPGVTRDRREALGTLGGLTFTVIDTAGFEDAGAETLEGRMRRQTEKAIADADVALFLVDAKAGITPLDEHFADLLRRGRTPVLLAANKTEGKGAEAALYDAFRLGLGEALALSAEHGQGLDALYAALAPYAPPEDLEALDEDDDQPPPAEGEEAPAGPPRPLQLAIIGRPNTGKSTLINRLVGEDRVLTGPEPGVTRDAIPIDWTYTAPDGSTREIRLVDTAGVRKRAKITDAVEKLSVGETFEAIRLAEVVVLVVDSESPLDNQELTLARHVAEEGRALVIAVNKWDLIKEKRSVLSKIEDRLQSSLAQVRGIPIVTLSAKTGQRVDGLMAAVFAVHEIWNKHIPTNPLNRWLQAATRAHPPPLSIHKQRIKLRYMTQAKTRPPTFVIFSTRAADLPDAYMRYLANGLRDTFDLDGVPIRIHLRKPKNPFEDEKGE